MCPLCDVHTVLLEMRETSGCLGSDALAICEWWLMPVITFRGWILLFALSAWLYWPVHNCRALTLNFFLSMIVHYIFNTVLYGVRWSGVKHWVTAILLHVFRFNVCFSEDSNGFSLSINSISIDASNRGLSIFIISFSANTRHVLAASSLACALAVAVDLLRAFWIAWSPWPRFIWVFF